MTYLELCKDTINVHLSQGLYQHDALEVEHFDFASCAYINSAVCKEPDSAVYWTRSLTLQYAGQGV